MRIFGFNTVLLSVVLLLVWYDSTSSARQLLKDEERPEEKPLSRERRGIGKVLISGSLALSVAGIAYDVFLTYDGCCKKYNACEKQKELGTLKTTWVERAENINTIALDASKVITFIDLINSKNQIIQTKLIKIIDKVDELVKTLSGDDLNSLKELQYQVEKIKNDNAQILETWTLKDIDLAFKGMSATTSGMAMLLGPLFFELGSHGLSMLYQDYKVRKISQALGDDLAASILRNSGTKYGGTNAFKMMGRPRFNNQAFLKETALARYKANRGKPGKFMSYASSAFSVFSGGLEVWHIFVKSKECKKSVDEIRKMHASMTEEIGKLDDQEATMQQAKEETKKAYTTLTDSISSEEFLAGIQSIINLVSDASIQNAITKQTVTNMTLFTDTIKSAVEKKESTKIVELQDTLSLALNNVSYTYDCYLTKAKSLVRIIDDCKNGKIEKLEDQYKELQDELKTCVIDKKANTPIYMSYDALEKYVAADAKENNYYSPVCRLNDAKEIKLICYDACDYSVEDAAKDHDITVDQVNVLCNGKCSLSPREKRRICKYKNRTSLEETITEDYGELYRDEITELYTDENACKNL